jgi:hypothetical protein
MADIIYTSFKRDIMNGAIDLDTDTIKVMLVTSSYTPSAAHTKRSDITNEVSGTGYTALGKTITTPTVTNVSTIGVFDGDDLAWTTSTITARGAVIFKSRGGASSADELIAYLDFTTDKVSTAGTFTISWNASGILSLS